VESRYVWSRSPSKLSWNNEVAKAKEEADKSKDKDVPLPTARTQNVRGGAALVIQ
jgi:hypothetical protein